MKKYAKWIGGGLGWVLGGPIGAILGFALGSLFNDENQMKEYAYSRRGMTGTQSGDFEVSLLILAAQVIKADGKVDPKELEFVRNTFKQMFGERRAEQSFRLFKNVIQNQEVSTRQVCLQISHYMDHPSRLQLLHFLFGIARVDGHVHQAEVDLIEKMSHYLNISSADFHSIRAMFHTDHVNYYEILEITKDASDDEVKKAYRKMAKKFHPDRVAHLGAEFQQGAKEKFQAVQEAYDKISKERGIN
jgi:DnaJ like chaperone protein